MSAAALILAAGSGTRMKSSSAKVAFEILGKPLIRWVVDSAHKSGCEEVIAVLGYGKDQVESLIPDVKTVFQSKRLGTGHAVLMAKDELISRCGDVVILSGDCPLITPQTISDLIDEHKQNKSACAILTFAPDDPTGYGRIVRSAKGEVEEIVEQKDCTISQAEIKECNSGIYCFNVEKLFDVLEKINNNNAQGEYYLTDVVKVLVTEGQKVIALSAQDPTEAFGINNRKQLAEATSVLQQRIIEKHMENGVTFWDPKLAWIGPDVELSNDVEILPMSFIMGKSSVDSGSIIGPTTRIYDSTIGKDCTIEESIILESQLGDGVSCGPRAYIRPGTYMCNGSKAGTHVEIKKSIIGERSKVPHLSYIGDTTIGEDVNIGAGSITCNYDGVKKSATTIGDRSFIGSDTMMVAPVEIGSDVVVGAGSTITHDIPDGALGIARAKQKNIENWKKKQKN